MIPGRRLRKRQRSEPCRESGRGRTPLVAEQFDGQELLASFLESLPGAAFVKDADGRYVYMSSDGAAVLGRTPEECLGRSVSELIPAHLAERLQADDDEALANGEVRTFLEELPGSGGTRFWQVTKFPIEVAGERLLAGFGVEVSELLRLRDERERLIAEQRASEERLRALARRLIDTQETERREIARELHDEIGQLLTVLKLLLSRLREGRARDEAIAVVDRVFDHVRDLTLSLRPPLLDTLGLDSALRAHVERFAAQSGLEASFRSHGLANRRLPSNVETTAFRVVQEALTNVARHARTAAVSVEVRAEEAWLTVEVVDRGVGFDPVKTQPSTGLSGLRERVRLVGGELAIDAAPAAGTAVRAELPLAPTAELP